MVFGGGQGLFLRGRTRARIVLIVHGLHATLLALGVRAWFEYVRTDANISDKPSREDLSAARYALGERGDGRGDHG